MMESLLLALAARAHQLQRERVQPHAHTAEQELFNRIRQEGLAVVAADVGLESHELLIRLLRRTLE